MTIKKGFAIGMGVSDRFLEKSLFFFWCARERARGLLCRVQTTWRAGPVLGIGGIGAQQRARARTVCMRTFSAAGHLTEFEGEVEVA